MIRVKAETRYALLLRHLAEQFFADTVEKDYEVCALWEDGAAKVRINGVWGEARGVGTHLEPHQQNKLNLGHAFADAAKKMGTPPPAYGLLTGVRPVKPAVSYLQHFSKEATAHFCRDYLVEEEKAKVLFSLAQKELQIKRRLGKRDVLLYLSIPFCPTRCSYCSFISSSAPKHLKSIPAYLELLEEELSQLGKLAQKHSLRIAAVYMGGGTPGILSHGQLDRLWGHTADCFDLQGSELTCELGRPDTVTKEKLAVLKQRGVERISINPQTTNDQVLRYIGRTHTAEDFFSAFHLAKSFGFASVNADLIAGLPGESEESFCQSVKDVLSLAPENLTVHSFCRKRSAETSDFPLCDRASAQRMLAFSHESCINAAYEPYYLYRQKNAAGALENTGYAREGKDCLYNIGMMEDLVPVLAAGAGGITKLPGIKETDKITRLAEFKYPFEYLSQPEKIRRNLSLLDGGIEAYYKE